MTNIANNVDAKKVSISIELLEQYVKDTSIDPLISVLEELKQEPNNESHLSKLSDTFKELGIIQGAVLTYAPYLSVLLAGNLFEDWTNEDNE